MNVHQHATACGIWNGGNKALPAEALISLDLFDVLVYNVKRAEEIK